MLPPRDPALIVAKLNEYLRSERSAVQVYELALRNVEQLDLPGLLAQCKESHSLRVELLRKQIVQLGGEPTQAPGPWSVIAQPVLSEPIQEKVGVAALEEFEYQDLKRYRQELAKLDDEARQLLRTQVLPEQERTYRTIKTIRIALG